jgi:glycosyltransferase involved in cell wall biosynthesis
MLLPIVICLTPVKNEAWILDKFLECASLWADYIIIADQNSDDGSCEIASRFEKVKIIQNPSSSLNEAQRQKLLLEAARKLPFPRLLIALDADEFLSPNFVSSFEWQSALNSQPGTIIKMPSVQIKPDMKHYWQLGEGAFGYIDDGHEHSGSLIHSPRVPLPSSAPEIKFKEVVVMHYQYVDWERMRCKHRWYQCWERLHNGHRSAIDIFRQYHHMYAVKKNELKEIPNWWFDGYSTYGIDIENISKEEFRWWDKEVLRNIEEYGAEQFSKESIWDVQWKTIAYQYGYKNTSKFEDPRSFLEKIVHTWLLKTQPYSEATGVRLIEKILKKYFGW